MIGSKFKWVIGLSLVFVLIITTNVIDRNSFKRINESIISIYEDRLIAKNYVFELSLLMEEKALALAQMDVGFYTSENLRVNDQIRSYLDLFHRTRLTAQELTTLDNFERVFEKLKEQENFIGEPLEPNSVVKLNAYILTMKRDLYTLSKIQLDEGKKQVLIGAKAVDSVELLTKLEIIMLTIIAVLVQFLLLYNPKNR